MKSIKSILERAAEKVFTAKSLEEAKTLFINEVSSSKINEGDKVRMVNTVLELESLTRVQSYLANALLKYEGHSLSKLDNF
jgi:hypothetical protein